SAPAPETPVYRHNRGLHVHSSNAQCLLVGRPRTLGRAVTSAAAETPVTRRPPAPCEDRDARLDAPGDLRPGTPPQPPSTRAPPACPGGVRLARGGPGP